MNGEFGIFDRLKLVAEFGNDVDADEELRAMAGHYIPERADELVVRVIPEDYTLWCRLLDGLKESRLRDIAFSDAGAHS